MVKPEVAFAAPMRFAAVLEWLALRTSWCQAGKGPRMRDYDHNGQDVLEAVDRIKKDTRELGEALRYAARQSMTDVQDSLDHTAEELRGTAERYVDRARENTQRKPLTSLLQWAGVGIAIGWLIAKRK